MWSNHHLQTLFLRPENKLKRKYNGNMPRNFSSQNLAIYIPMRRYRSADRLYIYQLKFGYTVEKI